MARKSISSNDNELATRAELEASNRQLRASLKRCEDLVSDCKDKLMQVYGLTNLRKRKDQERAPDKKRPGQGEAQAEPLDLTLPASGGLWRKRNGHLPTTVLGRCS